jgi:hypothetical protein
MSEVCNSELRSQNSLLKHHGVRDAKVYVCEICNKEVDDEQTLEEHAKKCANLMKQIIECRDKIKLMEEELKEDIYHYTLYYYTVERVARDQIEIKQMVEWCNNNPLK